MRLISIILFILIFILLLSCHKHKDDCQYHLQFSQIDTSLFISYKSDGKVYKYFQRDAFGYRTGSCPLFYGSKSDTACYCGDHYSFGRSKVPNDRSNPEVTIDIWNKCNYKFPNTELSKLIKDNYKFTYPLYFNPQINDTIFFTGVSLIDQQNGYSTISLMEYYQYGYDTIYNHVLKDSYFKITSVEPVCNNFYLIQGEFETALMSSSTNGVEQPKLIYLKEGKIRFIAY